MSLSVIIPIYNEEKNIHSTIIKLRKLNKKINEFKLIFIDDFSSDKTFEKISILFKKYSYISIYKNKKKD